MRAVQTAWALGPAVQYFNLSTTSRREPPSIRTTSWDTAALLLPVAVLPTPLSSWSTGIGAGPLALAWTVDKLELQVEASRRVATHTGRQAHA